MSRVFQQQLCTHIILAIYSIYEQAFVSIKLTFCSIALANKTTKTVWSITEVAYYNTQRHHIIIVHNCTNTNTNTQTPQYTQHIVHKHLHVHVHVHLHVHVHVRLYPTNDIVFCIIIFIGCKQFPCMDNKCI